MNTQAKTVANAQDLKEVGRDAPGDLPGDPLAQPYAGTHCDGTAPEPGANSTQAAEADLSSFQPLSWTLPRSILSRWSSRASGIFLFVVEVRFCRGFLQKTRFP